VQELIKPKRLPDDVSSYLSKFDLNACFTCRTCTNGCPITGTPGMEGWDIRKVIRMLALGLLHEVVKSKFPWVCTGCGSCAFGSHGH
jgi:dimethylglycine catabolism B